MMQMYESSYVPTSFGYSAPTPTSLSLRNDTIPLGIGSMNVTEPKVEEASTLFLGDLSVYCTEKDIRKLFRPFGVIEAIRVKRGSSNKTNLSYGFIKFSSRESADQALRQLNGVMFLGRSIKIGWAEGKSPNKIRVKTEKKVETAQVHVSFISKQIDVLISEATIRGLFGLYGPVVDVALKKSQFDKNLRIQNGYGFVHYPLTEEGIKSAITAVNSLHQVTIDRVTYDCSVSHALEPFVHHAQKYGIDSFPSNFASLLHSTALPSQEPARGSPPAPRIQVVNEDRMVDPLNLCRPNSKQITIPPSAAQYPFADSYMNAPRAYNQIGSNAPNMYSTVPAQQLAPNPFNGVHYSQPQAMVDPHLQESIFSFHGMPTSIPFHGNRF